MPNKLCKKGHELTVENTYPSKKGDKIYNRCKLCTLQTNSKSRIKIGLTKNIYSARRELASQGFQECVKCKRVMPLIKFFKANRAHSGYSYQCKECLLLAQKELRQKRKEIMSAVDRQASLKSRYDMTVEQYDELLLLQDNKCAICKTKNPGGRGRFHVDHDHLIGKNRGLLCHHCNLGLGNFKDDCDCLMNAINYLQEER